MPTRKINIRYETTEERVVSRIPEHYSRLLTEMHLRNAQYNHKPLMAALCVTKKRFRLLVDGCEPTLGEIDRYSQFFKLPITDLYTSKPYTKTIRK